MLAWAWGRPSASVITNVPDVPLTAKATVSRPWRCVRSRTTSRKAVSQTWGSCTTAPSPPSWGSAIGRCTSEVTTPSGVTATPRTPDVPTSIPITTGSATHHPITERRKQS